MATIDEIAEIAEKDLEIDPTNLSLSSMITPKLVNKYFQMLIKESDVLTQANIKLNNIYLELEEYYLGNAIPETYKVRPLAKSRILKSNLQQVIESDPIYYEYMQKVANQKMKIEYLREIIKQLNNRGFVIKNMIENEKFKNGGY